MSESTSQNPPMTRRQAREAERAAAFQRPRREQASEQVQLPPRPRGAESVKRAEMAPTVAFARPPAGEQPRLRPDRSVTASRVAAAVASGTRPARTASASAAVKPSGGGRAADARGAEVINLDQARAAATLRSGRPGGPSGRRRRRVVAGAAIAASAAVLASTGALAVMQGGSGQRDSGAPASANLLSGAEETPKPSSSATPQAPSPSVTPSTGAEQAPVPAQPESSAPSAQPASDPGEGASGQAEQVSGVSAVPVPQSVDDAPAPAYFVSTVSPEELAQASAPVAGYEQLPAEAAAQPAAEPQKPEPVVEEPVSAEPAAPAPLAEEPAEPALAEPAPVVEESAGAAPAEPEPLPEEPAPAEPVDVSADDSADAAAQPAAAQAPGQAAGSSVVETAQQYVGQVPYVLGGASPDAGFDCSGLVQYVYAQHGVSLPHSVSGQAAAGTVVDDPQPGDLVIFGNYHVGIYMGDGMMIDAPDTGRMVEIGGLDAGSDYYFVRI